MLEDTEDHRRSCSKPSISASSETNEGASARAEDGGWAGGGRKELGK
jgi:hypothetical protein